MFERKPNITANKYVRIKSGARLHIQLLDPVGLSGYKRGGIGIALDTPAVEIVATTSNSFTEEGYVQDTKYLKELIEEKGLDADILNLRIYVKSDIPIHSGLGSGTTSRTLIRKAICELLDIEDNIYALSSLTGVGQYAVLNGGLVVVSPVSTDTLIPSEIFRGVEGERITPELIGTYKLPKNWKAILCIPKDPKMQGLSGKKEFAFYSNLKLAKTKDVYRISFEIMTKLLPAIQYRDINKFEEALRTLTTLGWKKYEKKLHIEYWNETSKALYNNGAGFVGLTSGGPTVYTILDSNIHNIEEIRTRLEIKLADISKIVISDFDNKGFRMKKGFDSDFNET